MRILYCEDEPGTRQVVSVTLRNRGHDVDAAETAEEAKAIYDESNAQGKQYDLVITDIGMPVDSGFWLAGHVRGRGYDGRIAALTGRELESITAGLATVKAEYWPKPNAMRDLVNLVEGRCPEPIAAPPRRRAGERVE